MKRNRAKDEQASKWRGTSDRDLVLAMRAREAQAWSEYLARFRPALLDYARMRRMPSARIPECVDNVLEDLALRLTERDVEIPDAIFPYLVQCAYRRGLRLDRLDAARESRDRTGVELGTLGDVFAADGSPDAALADDDVLAGYDDGRGPDPALSTEARAGHKHRSSDPPAANGSSITRFVRHLSAELSDDERLLLAWIAAGVPQRHIAEWLGIRYDAASKRAWRLLRRLRMRAAALLGAMDDRDADAVLRVLRRAGSSLTLPPDSRDLSESGTPPTAPPAGREEPPTEDPRDDA